MATFQTAICTPFGPVIATELCITTMCADGRTIEEFCTRFAEYLGGLRMRQPENFSASLSRRGFVRSCATGCAVVGTAAFVNPLSAQEVAARGNEWADRL